jgi:hypothetical protein
MTRITRVEVITNNGREYVSWEDDNDIVTSIQDNGKTLKIFVNKVKPKTGEEGALEALEKFQNDWLLGKKCPETKLEIKKLDSVESIKAEIKMLQSKLSFYEELEKTKSPVEEAYKRCYGEYPVTDITDTCWSGNKWMSFVQGYGAAQEDYKVGEFQHLNEEVQEPEENEWKLAALRFGEKLSSIGPCGYYDFTPVEWYDWVVDIYENTANEYLKLLEKERARAKAQEHEKEQKWDVVRESVKWCEEHPDESVEDYLTPKTPEKTEQSLKTAFKEAQQTEKWKETQKKIDTPKESWMDKPIDELVDKLMENPPDCLKFQLGKTLEQIVNRWWEDTFTTHEKWTMEECIDDLIDQVELFLPREQSSEGSQDIYAVVAVDTHNDLLKKIKSKLRNKK